jgi:CBS domain containing-hemolysin-like protein
MDIIYEAIKNVIVFFAPGDSLSLKHFIIFFIALACSGIFSASEIAIFRLQEYQFKGEDGKIKNKYLWLSRLIKQKDKTLSTILIGNNTANVFATLYGTQLIATVISQYFIIAKDAAFALAGFTLIILLLIFGEIIPKSMAIHNSFRWAFLLTPIVYFFSKIFWVLTITTIRFSAFVNQFFKKSEQTVSDQQVLAMVSQGKKEGIFEKNEQDVIKNILNFNETSVVAIMTPRNKVFCLSEEQKISLSKEQIAEQGHSRIPVYKGDDRNNIVGIVNHKDVFKHILKKNGKGGKNSKIKSLMQKPTFIYQTTNIQSVFQIFQKEHKQIAIVVDDFGDFEGIVTMEDILEEIVGEIRDEKDKLQEDSAIVSLSKNKWAAKNIVDINSFVRFTGAKMDEHDDLPYETLQGLIMYKIGRLPKVGDKVEVAGFSFKVRQMEKEQISLMHIQKLSGKNPASKKQAKFLAFPEVKTKG